MQIVKVRLSAADLSREMAAMREWLDNNRYEPAKFDCDQDGVDVVLSVEFMLDEAAKAFAKRFDGKDGPRSSIRV
jgi:basic membrane lipoprotein Med (substrate-binding protein (PBP1-ABC) superfamily)